MSDDDQHIEGEEPSSGDESLEEVDLGPLLSDVSSEQKELSIEDELAALTKGDADSLLVEGDVQDVLGDGDMEERLDGGADDPAIDPEEAPLESMSDDEVIEVAPETSADPVIHDIDALLAGATDEGTPEAEAVESTTEISTAGLFSSGESTKESTEETASSEAPPEEDISEVAGENIAAGAAPEDELDIAQVVSVTEGEIEATEAEAVEEPPVDADAPPVEEASSEPEEETPAEAVTEEVIAVETEAEVAKESTDPEPEIEIIVLDEETSGSADFVVADPSVVSNLLKVPGAVIHIARVEPWRALTGMAAGLIVMLSTYIFMSMNELKSVDDATRMHISQDSDLQRSITAAEYLIEEEDFAGASSLIAYALDTANPKSPMYVDAEYVKLEADLKSLPAKVDANLADAAHGEIDHVVNKMPLHPKRANAFFWKGQLYEAEDNSQAARVEYRELLTNDPNATNRHEVLLALGTLELNTDRPVEGAKYLQQLRANFPGTDEAIQARLLIGDAYAAIGDMTSARATYIAIAEAHPDAKIGADAFARMGELAFESGDYDQAIRELEGRLNTARSVEGNDGVTLLLAKAYRASGRIDDAKNMLNGLIDFFPTSNVTPLARIEMSQVLDEMGLSREAVRYSTHSVQLFPDHPGVLRNAGELLAKSGDAKDAARSLLAAQFAGADDPELLLAAGRLFVQSGATDDAKKAFEQLLYNYAKSQQGIMGNIELSKLFFEEGHPSKAIDRLEELRLMVRTSSQQLPILLTLGNFYTELGMTTKVADTYGEIATLTNEPELLAQSAVALFEAGVTKEGLIIADRVEVQQLTNPTAYIFLNSKGRTLLQISAKEGLGYMEQAHAAYPEERSAAGVQELLEANLTLDRSARARALVSEVSTYVAQREHYNDRPRLERAATTWGNYLYERQDFRAAANAYEMALGSQVSSAAAEAVLTDAQAWMIFQRANALYRLSDYGACIPLYQRLSASGSQWAGEASAKLTSAQLEQRMRGLSVPETRNAG